MRILVVAHGYPPVSNGGTELYAQRLVREFAAVGDRVLVLARESDRRLREFTIRCESRETERVAWLNNTFRSARSFADTYADERIDARAAAVIDDFGPDVAHVHHLTGLSTGIVRVLHERGVPVFVTLHDYWLLCHRGQLLDVDLRACTGPAPGVCGNCIRAAHAAGRGSFTARRVLGRLTNRLPVPLGSRIVSATAAAAQLGARDRSVGAAAARWANIRSALDLVTHFFAPSEYVRSRFVDAGIPPGRISVSRLGWDPPGLSRRTARGAHSGRLRLGYAGSLMVSKAPHLIVEAASSLPAGSWTLDVFGEHADYHGDATYRSVLRQSFARPEVTIHGRIDRHQLVEAIGSLDALVVPSIWPENSPLVVRDAFSAGIPVIASNTGGIPELVTDGVNGFLFRPGDVGDLRNALHRLRTEPLKWIDRPDLPTNADEARAIRSAYAATLPPRERPSRKLAAVVLNYGTPDDTFLAVRSLLLSRRPLDRIIVVDNHPGSACEQALATLPTSIRFIRSGSNVGYAAGMNLGIRQALDDGADAVLLANSDVVVPADGVRALERQLEMHPGAGIVGPLVLERARPDCVSSAGISYDVTTGRMRLLRHGASFSRDAVPCATTVDAVSGCLMLVSRRVFDAIGFLESSYFFGFEDIDFCLRARGAGFATILAPGATVLHEGGRSIGRASPKKLYYAARNHLRLATQPASGESRLGVAARATFVACVNVLHAFRPTGGSLVSRLSAVARGTRDGLRTRSAPGRP